jgi:hypothetical protein
MIIFHKPEGTDEKAIALSRSHRATNVVVQYARADQILLGKVAQQVLPQVEPAEPPVKITIISSCSLCGKEIDRKESVWPRSVYDAQVKRGYVNPFKSHGVCPGENPCKRFIADDVIGEGL